MNNDKPKRTSNTKCRDFVRARETFTANNICGITYPDPVPDHPSLTPRYVVFSYGMHWPMFIWQDGVWYENIDRYSRTTSKHHGQAHPHPETTNPPTPCIPMTVGAMRRIMRDGIAGLALFGEA